jgi:exo-beta-1,3-glucanase (GH17 family)
VHHALEAPLMAVNRALIGAAIAIGMLGLWTACGSAHGALAAPFIGVNYGPFHKEGQRPGAATDITEQQILEDLKVIAGAGFRQIRTYGLDKGLSRIVPLAQQYFPEIRFFIGVYVCGLTRDDPGNQSSTRAQLDEALRLANAYRNVAGVVVGNECLAGEPEACPQPVSVDQLIADLDYVRKGLSPEARRSVRITSAMSMVAAVKAYATQGRRIAPHCDVIMVNIHPFFASVPVEEAVHSNLDASYRRLVELYAPAAKPIVVGETGWPSAGAANGRAVPGLESQRRFIQDVVRYARTHALGVFLFEMFDEPWKMEAGAVGPHWGLFDRDGRAKFPLPGWN